jgi:polar amino acid transport system permease protein
LWAGIIVTGLNGGAYGAEIVRGAVQSVPRAQYEGATALSFTPAQRMWRVILPQAFIEMLPPFNNLFIQLLKGSSLVSLIFLADITYQGRQVLATNYGSQTLLIFAMMLVMYLILSLVITLVMRLLERWAGRMLGRTGPSGTESVVSLEAGLA